MQISFSILRCIHPWSPHLKSSFYLTLTSKFFSMWDLSKLKLYHFPIFFLWSCDYHFLCIATDFCLPVENSSVISKLYSFSKQLTLSHPTNSFSFSIEVDSHLYIHDARLYCICCKAPHSSRNIRDPGFCSPSRPSLKAFLWYNTTKNRTTVKMCLLTALEPIY